MSKPFDYSKWDNIELSDDEDDVHPNIERESWFRMKHRARVEREEREEADKKKIRAEMSQANVRIEEIERILKKLSNTNDDDEDSDDDLEDEDGLRVEIEELRKENAARQKKLDDYEKNKKWNVDNMCQVVEERTIVNPKAAQTKYSPSGFALPDDDDDNEDQTSLEKKIDAASLNESAAAAATTSKATTKTTTSKASASKKSSTKATTTTTTTKKATPSPPQPTPSPPKPQQHEPSSLSILSYSDFVDKHADLLEKWMTIQSLEKCKDFLLLHGDILLQENATNYLLLASLEDEMNGFREKMKLTARQSQILTNIAELAKSLRSHPGNVILPFFQRIEKKEYYDGFVEGVDAFIAKIKKRAVEKKKEMDAQRAAEGGGGGDEVEEVDLASVPKEERLGPGGLDPLEVFESLPESMQKAFESRDVENLKQALLAMDPKDAEYHMKRCVGSGLWNE